jgi:NAD(P)-dependent dehydrogenase (short-subunit alcohol dehydrogenase family)
MWALLTLQDITILQADLNDNPAVKKAAADVAEITEGSLDYLIGNAAYLALYDQFDGPSDLIANTSVEEFGKEFDNFMHTNVLAQIFLYEAFLPLILKGKNKKVLSISTGMADPDFNREWDHTHAIFYSSSKAALNMVNVKYGAQYKKDGVLFISMCPGLVDTGAFSGSKYYQLYLVYTVLTIHSAVDAEQGAKLQAIIAKFQAYAPNFKGAYEPVDSAKHMLSVLDKLSVENGDTGKYLSHLGTKRWLP